jgi:hypothetical protein
VKHAGVALGATAMLALGVLAQSCASVLGVDGAFDAVAAMCQCSDQLQFLGNAAVCEEIISRRVDGASEETRRQWLERFAAEECEECANVLDCYYQTPTCNTGQCTTSVECCGHDDGSGYCLQGTCRRKAPGCKPTNSGCKNPDECCGSESGLAECFFGKCVENCSVGNAANCHDCCMYADVKVPGTGIDQRAICLERSDPFCDLLCDPTKQAQCDGATEECQATCDINDPNEGLCAYVCAP